MARSITLIGVDLGATNVRAGRIEGSAIVELVQEPIVRSDSPDDLIAQLTRLIASVHRPDAAAIGIGVPSVVDPVRGIVYDVQNIPAWKEVPLASILQARFNLPVHVNNDANCFVLGEAHFGVGRSDGAAARNVVGLILGTGFGAGLVLDGRLFSGPHCGAGEVGMLPYRESIFEHYCSGQFFERHHGRRGAEVHRSALAGDTESLDILQSFGSHLGEGIKAVLYAYDPELIVLGGSASLAFDLYRDATWASISTFAYPRSLEGLRIEVSRLEQAAVLGAAALHLDLHASHALF
jgi:glucokinase